MNNAFPQYNTDYISGVMSLRKPQEESLKRLEKILSNEYLAKNIDLGEMLGKVHNLYPTCSDFERDFFSITFALATGVGKTRLIGAFITYLYTNYGIKNFFVVAPGTTVYKKLRSDLGDPNSKKYVFNGIGCFSNPPRVIDDEEYKEATLNLWESDINIFVFNIGKFDKEKTNMRKISEYLGQSFFDELAGLEDLVMIMDESHHYRAERGAAALNELKPLLGLELTATPLFKKGNKQIPFKNVVYEYPLSKAIEDGYTRTPFAVTRSDISFYNFGDEQLDKLMLQDGLLCHERAKIKLIEYAENSKKHLVKPFMLVVCKDTNHAKWVEKFIKSDEFSNGGYKNKVITVHSNQTGSETEANMQLLLEVEQPNNPVEIVIHVNMLKEGWDVNNLYTIVPLRTAASKILREQMVGRGLRLPYGSRTGDKDVDAVMLTAHDKFNDILAEAQKGDSIFKAGNIIKAEDLVPEKIESTQLTLKLDEDENQLLKKAYESSNINKSENTDSIIKMASKIIKEEVSKHIQKSNGSKSKPIEASKIVETVKKKVSENKDLGDVFKENEMPLAEWLKEQTEETHREAISKFIPIPRIKVTESGIEEYVFVDFDIDFTDFTQVPINNELLIQSLEDMKDRERIIGHNIDFEGYNPTKVILNELRMKPEIDYGKCSDLLFKVINQVCEYFTEQHGINGMKNIIMMYKRDVSTKIYTQMMQNFYCENGFLQEEVIDAREYNLQQTYTYDDRVDLFSSYTKKIQSVLFDGIKKGAFNIAKFDSHPELVLARILEVDPDVINWLRPSPQEFNITYNKGKLYEPDFVVETDKVIYLVEVKGEDRLKDPDVIAKKNRAIKYCDIATTWGKANGYKEWRYLFIPSKQIMANSSFTQLSKQFYTL
ncbi:DEAD/DEAH box helicase [Lysinibacillus sp. BPa_S21]|uniref:DEAD/DEAH box helicase n=1 Tax=Lysinibacillus sp. BPa_S21 TaxID=2932478 RepID=UPI0020138EDB|nr:DEAD/DEAH box helicase family protein [Lysinibacillus sp. BPa_S21]MCL1697330.1 DEAD/DEAH box helicase family protein [Lysinibacillus sp. BPa_S21]